MKIDALQITDFRNLESVQLNPHPNFNVIHGLNGQGKTNLLESIYWLSALRTPRTTRIRELVRWKKRHCRVDARVHFENLDYRLSVDVKDGVRQAFRENKKTKARDYFGVLSAIIFTPDDGDIVRGSPEKRRKFLDRAIFTGRPQHLDDFLHYRRALDGRNKLLRDGAPDALLEAYEEPLARAGASILDARRKYVEYISEPFSHNLSQILNETLVGTIRYRSSIDVDNDKIAESLRSTWANDRSKDRDRGFTQRGPHADDLVISISGRSARVYGSKGQQRSLVLALKTAEIQLLNEKLGCAPIVLLDDVSSELDYQRNARFFEFLGGFKGQVFITTTDPNFLLIDGNKSLWHVHDGRIVSEE